MNFILALGAVSLLDLNFQSVKTAGQIIAIVALNNSIVLGALRGLLSSVNNTTNGVQGVGLADLICKSVLEIRINVSAFQHSNVVRSAVNAYLGGVLEAGQLALNGSCLNNSALSSRVGSSGVVQSGNNNDIVLLNVGVDVVILKLDGTNAVVDGNLLAVYSSNASQLGLNNVCSLFMLQALAWAV